MKRNVLLQIRHRFGLYDEISESPTCVGGRLRQCNWIRFLRHSLVYNEEVNVVATKGPTGEPVFDMVKDVGPKTELVAFFVPERPEEAFLLPAIQYLRHTLFKRLVDNVLEESPLDLSTSLVMSKVAAVAAVAAPGAAAVVAALGAATEQPAAGGAAVRAGVRPGAAARARAARAIDPRGSARESRFLG